MQAHLPLRLLPVLLRLLLTAPPVSHRGVRWTNCPRSSSRSRHRRTPDEAWLTLTDPDRVVLWFTDASPVGAVGTPYRLDFGDGSVVEGVIREVDPGHGFAHTWAWADADPRPGDARRVGRSSHDPTAGASSGSSTTAGPRRAPTPRRVPTTRATGRAISTTSPRRWLRLDVPSGAGRQSRWTAATATGRPGFGGSAGRSPTTSHRVTWARLPLR